MEYLKAQYFGNPLSNYIAFSAIILACLLLRRLLSRVLSSLLYRILGKFGEGVSVEHFIEMLITPIQSLITHVLFFIAIKQIQYPLNEELFTIKKASVTAHDIIERVFLLLIVLDIFKILFKIIDFVAEVFEYRASLTDSKDDDQLVPFLKELVRILVYITEGFVILGIVFGVNIGTLTAGFGIGGVAIALAAKESLANLLSSFTIFMDKPFLVGDIIKVDNIEGTVERVGFRSTRIRTPDKSLVTLPNSKLVDGALDNMTLRNDRRLKFSIALDTETSASTLKAIIQDIRTYLHEHGDTTQDIVISFEGFGQFSLNIEVMCFVTSIDYANYARIREAINYAILKIIRNNKAVLAIPIQKVLNKSL